MSMSQRESSVLVTGGAGFIGSHVVDRLLAAGQSVVAIDDLSTGRLENLEAARSHPRFRLISQPISQLPVDELRELARSVASIYHLAAAVGVDLVLNSPIRSIEINLHATEAILEAASAAGTPVLLASSSEVYGRSSRELFSEEDDLVIGSPTCTRWNYACSKLMDEFLALAHARERGLPVIVARLFNTVGPRQVGDHGMVLPRFIAAARTGKSLRVFGDGTQTRCFSYVDDVVNALLRLQENPRAHGQIVNVGSTEEICIAALAQQVIAELRSPSVIEFVPYDKAYGPGFDELFRRRPDTRRLRELTGLAITTPVSQVIQQTIAWEGGRGSVQAGKSA